MSYLELNEVSFAYPNGHQALENVSLKVEKGESVAIIGENGAGKTTMAKLINGLLKPTVGTVTIDGWITTDYTTAQISKKVGYVFQNPDDQIFHNSVYKEIAFAPKNQKRSNEEIDQNVKYAAQLTEISHLLDTNPYDLPLSIRKFVTIASVIAMDVDVLILDEPTAGQDKRGLDTLMRMISALVADGKTIMTITHDMEFVANNFKRTVVMAHKNKIADDHTRRVFWQDDILREAGLKPPHISKLGRPFTFAQDVLTIDEFISRLDKAEPNAQQQTIAEQDQQAEIGE